MPKIYKKYKKNNICNIRLLVDDSFVPSFKQPSVIYFRLTDFKRTPFGSEQNSEDIYKTNRRPKLFLIANVQTGNDPKLQCREIGKMHRLKNVYFFPIGSYINTKKVSLS